MVLGRDRLIMGNEERKRRLRTVFQQIGAFRGIKILLARLVARFLDPGVIPSYSQFGEDRVIGHIFNDKYNGYYVDVGCNHPILYSNTWKLYLNGWRGMVIDANEELIREYKKVRPNDISVQEVISDSEECLDYYFSNNSNLISGVGAFVDDRWGRDVDNCKVVKVRPRSLDDLFLKYGVPRDFDLLSIDVEGHELNVLRSMNFSIYRPRLIIVEIHDLNILGMEENPIYKTLNENGYALNSIVGPSFFFLVNDLS